MHPALEYLASVQEPPCTPDALLERARMVSASEGKSRAMYADIRIPAGVYVKLVLLLGG